MVLLVVTYNYHLVKEYCVANGNEDDQLGLTAVSCCIEVREVSENEGEEPIEMFVMANSSFAVDDSILEDKMMSLSSSS